MNEAKTTFIVFTLFLIRNPQATIAINPEYTKRLNPFFRKRRSARAIAASGIIKARRLSLNWAPANMAKAPTAVKFQVWSITKGKARVNAAKTTIIVNTIKRGDSICFIGQK